MAGCNFPLRQCCAPLGSSRSGHVFWLLTALASSQPNAWRKSGFLKVPVVWADGAHGHSAGTVHYLPLRNDMSQILRTVTRANTSSTSARTPDASDAVVPSYGEIEIADHDSTALGRAPKLPGLIPGCLWPPSVTIQDTASIAATKYPVPGTGRGPSGCCQDSFKGENCRVHAGNPTSRSRRTRSAKRTVSNPASCGPLTVTPLCRGRDHSRTYFLEHYLFRFGDWSRCLRPRRIFATPPTTAPRANMGSTRAGTP